MPGERIVSSSLAVSMEEVRVCDLQGLELLRQGIQRARCYDAIRDIPTPLA